MANKTKRDWNALSKEEKLRIMKLADSLFIHPQYVQDMYEKGQIS